VARAPRRAASRIAIRACCAPDRRALRQAPPRCASRRCWASRAGSPTPSDAAAADAGCWRSPVRAPGRPGSRAAAARASRARRGAKCAAALDVSGALSERDPARCISTRCKSSAGCRRSPRGSALRAQSARRRPRIAASSARRCAVLAKQARSVLLEALAPASPRTPRRTCAAASTQRSAASMIEEAALRSARESPSVDSSANARAAAIVAGANSSGRRGGARPDAASHRQ